MRPSGEITRIVLLVLFIGMMLAGSFWTLLPFLGGLVWAATVVIATWPLLLQVRDRIPRRPWVAVLVMTSLTLLAVILPFAFAVSTLLDVAHRGPEFIAEFTKRGLGPPPDWLDKLPVVGRELTVRWQAIAAGGPDALVEAARPYLGAAAQWAISVTGGIGMVSINILLTIILVAILYSQGELAARGALAFGFRLGGERGMEVIKLAAQAVRSVALGVVVTALVQSLIGGIGLAIAGVPFATILTAVMFLLAVAQIGAVPILVLADIWLFWSGQSGWGVFLVVVTVIAGTLDNFLRPYLIKQGAAELPLLLIFIGVIGGLIAFGLIGIFVGPMVLAVTHTLMRAWLYSQESPAAVEVR